MYQFFYPDGESIKAPNQREKFVEFYNQCYYLRVSPYIEQDIEAILKNSAPLTRENIIKILEWKTGGKYIEKEGIIRNQYRTISVSEVKDKLGKMRGFLSMEECINLLKTLCEIDGVGIVYAITLLHFVTNGKQYPIYDKFSHIALLAIMASNGNSEKKYGGIGLVTDSHYNKEINLQKTKKDKLDVEGIFEQYLRSYVNPINEIFSDVFGCNYGETMDQNANRDIDRALWTYGHLFNENENNKKRIEIS